MMDKVKAICSAHYAKAANPPAENPHEGHLINPLYTVEGKCIHGYHFSGSFTLHS